MGLCMESHSRVAILEVCVSMCEHLMRSKHRYEVNLTDVVDQLNLGRAQKPSSKHFQLFPYEDNIQHTKYHL